MWVLCCVHIFVIVHAGQQTFGVFCLFVRRPLSMMVGSFSFRRVDAFFVRFKQTSLVRSYNVAVVWLRVGVCHENRRMLYNIACAESREVEWVVFDRKFCSYSSEFTRYCYQQSNLKKTTTTTTNKTLATHTEFCSTCAPYFKRHYDYVYALNNGHCL